MTGSIRLVVGFLVVLGAVGQLDFDPTASLLYTTITAVVGLVIMGWGVLAMKGNQR